MVEVLLSLFCSKVIVGISPV